MKPRILGLALLAALGLAACGDDDNSSPDVNNGITARLRAVHVAPGTNSLDVLVGGTPQFTNIAYGQPTDYQEVPTGSQTLTLVATGDTTTYGSLTRTLELNQNYTLLATGLPGAVEPVLLTDTSTAPASGKIRLRLVHASPSAGAVDVYVGAQDQDIASVTPTLSNVTTGTASDYLTLDAGTYRIRLTALGGKDPLFDETVTVSEGAVRTIIVRDAAAGGVPLGAVVLDDRA